MGVSLKFKDDSQMNDNEDKKEMNEKHIQNYKELSRRISEKMSNLSYFKRTKKEHDASDNKDGSNLGGPINVLSDKESQQSDETSVSEVVNTNKTLQLTEDREESQDSV